ncbi:hypothetical protein [Nitrogeniibacter aestuarii]|uniref:hypothetical protein n=1 Tax=Nitrogeniibacter aestuarii TaxID=2815343 RepID=UPI001D129DAF|nr:hypothetical protein [Nitrogeniibacter aestuarii]
MLLKTIRALLRSNGGELPWHWEIIEASREATVRELKRSGSADSTRVFAFGASLSTEARVIAALSPTVLDEVAAAGTLCDEARERLEVVKVCLDSVRRRVYAARQTAHYADLRLAASELSKALELLERERWFEALSAFEAWDDFVSPEPLHESPASGSNDERHT